jgi:hypothetical protein
VLPILPIAALRKSFQTIEFFFSPAFQPRLQIRREALVFLKEETAWKLVDINYLHPASLCSHCNCIENLLLESSWWAYLLLLANSSAFLHGRLYSQSELETSGLWWAWICCRWARSFHCRVLPLKTSLSIFAPCATQWAFMTLF